MRIYTNTKCILCAAVLLVHVFVTPANSQPSNLPVSLNHLMIVLDSETYHHFFDSKFFCDSIGNCKEDTMVTPDRSWFGKYLSGKNGYLELFSAAANTANLPAGALGFGFITAQFGDLSQIKNKWQKHYIDTVYFNTQYSEYKGQKLPWYNVLTIDAKDSMQTIFAWLMENTSDELKRAGFNDSDIMKPISWEEYSNKSSGKTITKLFDHISEVYLSVTKNQFEYLRETFTGIGLKQKENTFVNEAVKIICDINSNSTAHLQSISLTLTKNVSDLQTQISDHLILKASGNTAVLKFF
jgi:hypothetical protein